MNEEIKVHVVKRDNRKHFQMRYVDPMTSKQIARSTGTDKRREAEKVAAVWQAELREGRYRKKSLMTWDEFREHHELHKLSAVKKRTAETYEGTLNVFTRLASPKKLSDATTARVTAFATKLRGLGRSEATVARHLRQLKVVLRWAQRQGYMTTMPMIEMPRSPKAMRGRPITEEEFHIMLAATPQVVGSIAAPSWQFLLRGYWTSGLRLREACNLHWNGSRGHIVDFSRKRPMFRICGALEKGGRDRLLPMAPEFARLLESIPPEHRYGPVFEVLSDDGKKAVSDPSCIGKRVSDIGKIAGIVVESDPHTGEPSKYASAHDLRRSFGFRWSRRVMPPILKEMMRHAKIETTLKFYVGENADATAEELWNVIGDTLGDTKGVGLNKLYKTSDADGNRTRNLRIDSPVL